MPNIRIGFASDFTLKGSNIGIGTTTADVKLQVPGTLKGDLSITGVSTLAVYGGFAAQKQNITKDSSIGFSTTGIGTVGITSFISVNERETGFLSLVGEYNTVSEDLIVDEGKIFEISTTNITGITTLGTQEVYAPDPSVVSVGTLESVSIQSHFSVPDGGISERVDNPIEGSVRFNDDLNTLEFYNGVEWRQFTVTGASGRGVFGGGYSPGNQTVLDVVNIQTQGNAIRFGDLSTSRRLSGSCSSATRGLWGGGQNPGEIQGIEYITLASEGNGISFGNLQTSKTIVTAISSSTRGIWGGGYDTPANINVIDYVEIHTLGNALDFGDLSIARNSAGSVSSPIRGLWGGGDPQTQVIDFITISSKGNAVYFGDLTEIRRAQGTCSNSTRGLFGGGVAPSGSPTSRNTIDYVTIASTGDATDFGDLTVETFYLDAVSTQTRGVFGGGVTINTMSFITITSTGNAQDFGDLVKERYGLSACSDSHGGLGGF